MALNLDKPRTSNPDDSKVVWLRLPYTGSIGKWVVNQLVWKSSCLNKDHTHMNPKCHTIYKLTRPACNTEYVCRQDQDRWVLNEHGTNHNSAKFHLQNCAQGIQVFVFFTKFISGMIKIIFIIPDIWFACSSIIILNNATVIACNNNFSQLCFLDSLWVRNSNPHPLLVSRLPRSFFYCLF